MAFMEASFKESMYRTAIAKIACAHFGEGEYVSVQWSHQSPSGIHWYHVTGSNGDAMYPMHHLERFVL